MQAGWQEIAVMVVNGKKIMQYIIEETTISGGRGLWRKTLTINYSVFSIMAGLIVKVLFIHL